MVNWKKILVVTFNVIIGIYLLLAVTAFNRPAEKDVVCNGVKVTIEKGMIEGVLTAADVTRMDVSILWGSRWPTSTSARWRSCWSVRS